MADYAPNFTARYKLRYIYEGDTHVNVTRWPSGSTKAANEDLAIAFWTAFFTATEDLRHVSFEVVDAEYAAGDSNVFLPATAPTEIAAGTIAGAGGASTSIAHSIWQGRSILGARCRFQMFGLYWSTLEDNIADNFYVTTTENAVVGTVAGLLTSAGMVGPDDESVAIWRSRVAYKQNDAWVGNRRRGAS